VVGTLCRNAALAPGEAKFRRVRLGNKKIQATLGGADGAGVAAMEALGWTRSEQEGEAFLVLPEGAKLTMEEVRAVEAAKDAVKREEARRLPAARKVGGAALRQQLEADRRERAAQEPVTRASKSQWEGGNGGIVSAKDVGIGCSAGN